MSTHSFYQIIISTNRMFNWINITYTSHESFNFYVSEITECIKCLDVGCDTWLQAKSSHLKLFFGYFSLQKIRIYFNMSLYEIILTGFVE